VTNSSREGSDSAPHILEAKKGGKKAAAGCFTQGWATQLVVGAVEEGIAKGWLQEEVSAEILEEFLGGRGRRFYKLKEKTESGKVWKILLENKGAKVPETLRSEDGCIEVVPFRRGEAIWRLTWKPR
jgi:dihydroorotase